MKDLHSATADVNRKEKELRVERLRLIKAKVSEHLDEDVDAIFQGSGTCLFMLYISIVYSKEK
jgi:hypothetical protein